MVSQVKTFFESAYSAEDTYWWRVPYAYSTCPDDLAPSLLGQATLRFALSRPAGRAIDVGSGEGADAIRLARLGWQVEAVELTSAGCSKIRTVARALDVDVKIYQADIVNFVADGEFDIVLCNGLLHYIKDKVSVCKKLQQMSTVGGAHFVSLWSDYTPVPECHRVIPVYPDQERGVVYEAYAHWEKNLLYYERARREEGHDEMGPHVHSHIKMIAVRKEL